MILALPLEHRPHCDIFDERHSTETACAVHKSVQRRTYYPALTHRLFCVVSSASPFLFLGFVIQVTITIGAPNPQQKEFVFLSP